MTDILELFRGVGVIIDDDLKVENRDDNQNRIWKIKESFEDKNIPILSYSELPKDEIIQNLGNISFLLLDWDLYGNLPQGISKPQTAEDDNIDFIEKFNKVCFAPIFIFSNEDTDYIKSKLTDAKLYNADKSNHIFVESKSSVKTARMLLSKIERWLKNTPSIYVLKEWGNSLSNAKRDLFFDFYGISPSFPKILQETFIYDGVDENHELGALIYKNLIARISPICFDENILNKSVKKASTEELRKILECERFLKKDKLSDIPATGDIFKETNKENGEAKDRYLINIRPDCDYIREAKKGKNVELYCLKGRIISESNINSKKDNNINFEKGNFLEKINNTIISFIDDGKIVEFLLQDVKLKKWNEVKNNRIGRLLPPYITRLQQKYAFYLQRQGLPAIPDKAIK